jgi:hypothetical protein
MNMAPMVIGAGFENTASASLVGTKPSTRNAAAPASAVTSGGYFSHMKAASSATISAIAMYGSMPPKKSAGNIYARAP